MAMRLAVATSERAEVEAAILDEYRDRTPGSAARHAAAKRVMPGGDTRTVAFHAPYPLTIAAGQGCRIDDVDGNRYLDLLNNYTSLIHGHAHPAITAAVAEQLPKGTAFAAGHEAQTRLAELITGRVASVDLVRFTNSGSEATMNAVRAARAFTGRDLIVKMEGGYHGTYDDFEISVHPDPADPRIGPPDAPLPLPDSPGLPRATTDAVLVTPFNDVAAAERLLTERGDEVAAVIVEPVMGSAGMIPARPEFLRALRALTVAHGALLICDEVMTFRLAPGGMQAVYRVRPDLTTFAKIIGGGFPVGAFGGRAEVMEQYDPSRPTPLWQSGTFNGNAVTMVAGAVALEHYGPAEVERINRLGERLRAGLNEQLRAAGIPGEATGYGSFVNVHLTARNVHDYRSAAAGDRALQRLMHLALLLEGIFCAPRLLMCISTPMTEAEIDETLAAVARALARIRPAIDTRRSAFGVRR